MTLWRLAKRLLLFCLLGSMIWLANQLWTDWQFRVVYAPSAAELAQLEAIWSQQNGQAFDATLRQALLQQELDDRRVFREALRLGLHLKDPVVLRRLLQDARFIGLEGNDQQLIQTALDLKLYSGDELIRRRLIQQMQAIAEGPPATLSEADLQLAYQQFLNDWQAPLRFSFEHLFFRISPDRNSEQTHALAVSARERLQRNEQASADAFLHGRQFEQQSLDTIREMFGSQFAQAVSQLPSGPWSAPIQSRYGWHLVHVSQREPQTPPTLDQIRHQLAAEHRKQIAQSHWDDYRSLLRERYRVMHR